ncbi:Rv1535 family protein [Mycobacterium sp.]|uniref:Rv1535 family protein n=1 Tax=Mycobacterium sp. TaxID=1785 RepID=UPI003C73D2BD
MTAVPYDDVAANRAAQGLTSAPAPSQASKRHHPPAGDPVVAAARLLSIPLRQVYALLWRAGLIEVTA